MSLPKDARQQNIKRIAAAAQTQRARLEEERILRVQSAATLVNQAASDVVNHGKAETTRATSKSAARAARIRALPNAYPGTGEKPLAAAKSEAAERIAIRAAEEFFKSGQSLSSKVLQEAGTGRAQFQQFLAQYAPSVDQAVATLSAKTTETEQRALSELNAAFNRNAQSEALSPQLSTLS